MAFIPCPRCGESVEDQAPSCPYCGTPSPASGADAPIQPSRRADKRLLIPIIISMLLLILGMAMAIYFTGVERPDTTMSTPAFQEATPPAPPDYPSENVPPAQDISPGQPDADTN